MTRKTIHVDYLARVEGEGALHIDIDGDVVRDVRLEIFEPPRFFEAFLRGRHFTETTDIVARICGICPVAYQMSAVHALEKALDVHIPDGIRSLRRMLYCGEWIESHVLHIYMLHAPDFLGYAGAVEMARDFPDIVKRGLAMKKAGNAILQVLGGREIHPINIKVGGFYRAPLRRELAALREDLLPARDAAVETVRWAASLEFPNFERDYEFVSLKHAAEYPMNEGRITSNAGIDIDAEQYEAVFEERHVPHSTALQSVIRERGVYLCGPMARFAMNHSRLGALASDLVEEFGHDTLSRNPFKSIVVRAIEVVQAFDEAIAIIDGYTTLDSPSVAVEARASAGEAATEAPRGLLYHRYELDDEGLITFARIIPPTSQNQGMIESDLRELVERNLDLDDETLQHRCEQSIRNYDPCISCSTHFLTMDVSRR